MVSSTIFDERKKRQQREEDESLPLRREYGKSLETRLPGRQGERHDQPPLPSRKSVEE
jgi:hypothetical protein